MDLVLGMKLVSVYLRTPPSDGTHAEVIKLVRKRDITLQLQLVTIHVLETMHATDWHIGKMMIQKFQMEQSSKLEMVHVWKTALAGILQLAGMAISM